MKDSILNIADLLIKKGLPYAIYCLPGDSTFNLVFQKSKILGHFDILNIENASGFVVAPFDSAKTGMANLIIPDFVLTEGDNTDAAIEFINTFPDNGNFHFTDNFRISKSDYLERASYLINMLKKGELQKVVLSRVVQKNLKTKLNINKLLKKLKEKYNDAFVYLFHLPDEGTWCGASPETLFKVVKNSIFIDALAGTQLVNNDNPPTLRTDKKSTTPIWTPKENEEQNFVSLFIKSLLSELGINNYKQTGPVTVYSGNLAHLKTTFNIPVSFDKSKTGRLIAGLHPTPAVCGLPKAEAYMLIQKAEQHQRRYYTGFLGPWKMGDYLHDCNQVSQLFVNLRCAELDHNKINIYVGGGLTTSSNPKAEYQETVHKSQTLVSVVENL
ncbi:MAG: chorismate-binding protein [Bacteroidetes bacterium]|nr:chorismate-binding protein [Bacteroidota bacterium]MBL6944264.1 chorismate-binding protein [Bacteroidales bacterium]